MDANRPDVAKSGRTFDSAYSFSFSIVIGLVLFIAGLVISRTLGQGATIGLIFGVPLLIAGLVLPVFMMRDLFHHNEVNGACPFCGEPITDFDEIFNRYVRAIDDRQRKVISLVSKEGSTAFEIARKLFPDSINQDVHRFLAISEAVAHLDYAEGEGKLAMEMRDGIEMYRPV